MREYLEYKKSAIAIAKDYNCSISTVYRYLRKFNIVRRSASETNKLRGPFSKETINKLIDKAKGRNKGKSNPMYGIKFFGKNNPNYRDGRTLIEKLCKTCHKLLKDYQADFCRSCCKLKDKNPNWKNGLSNEPYSNDFNSPLKLYIRTRDDFKCILCNKSEEILQSKLHVHHIDYNKQNCNECNLISLCSSCHAKTNYKRDYWYAYFKYVMESGGISQCLM